jgi:hypothetical protein
MAFKKMRFSFDIDMNVLMSVLAAHGSAMNVDILHDNKTSKTPKQLNGHAPKLLEGPKPRGTTNRGKAANGEKVTAYSAILAFFAANKDRGFRATELKPVLAEIGLSEKSVSPQLTKLRQDGFVKKNVTDKLYHVTGRGIAHHGKTIAADASASPEA